MAQSTCDALLYLEEGEFYSSVTRAPTTAVFKICFRDGKDSKSALGAQRGRDDNHTKSESVHRSSQRCGKKLTPLLAHKSLMKTNVQTETPTSASFSRLIK